METLKELTKQTTAQIDRERGSFASSLGVTGVQMSVIDFLSSHQNNPASQNEAEYEFNIKRSITTIMLRRVEKRGLIVRVDDPEDKRKEQARLTESALKVVLKIRQHMKQDNEGALDSLSTKDVNTITAFLRDIKEGKANDQGKNS